MPALSRQSAGVPRGFGGLFNWIRRAHDYYFSLPRLQFEAMTAGLALAFGLLVMPPLIWVAGRYTLGPYAGGGVFGFYFDFLKGLVQLRPSCWIALAGPLGFLWLTRLFRLTLRHV